MAMVYEKLTQKLHWRFQMKSASLTVVKMVPDLRTVQNSDWRCCMTENY